MLFTNGLYRIITNKENGSDCKNDDLTIVFFLILYKKEIKCEKNWITVYSLGNVVSNDEVMKIQGWINFVTIFFIIFGL